MTAPLLILVGAWASVCTLVLSTCRSAARGDASTVVEDRRPRLTSLDTSVAPWSRSVEPHGLPD